MNISCFIASKIHKQIKRNKFPKIFINNFIPDRVLYRKKRDPDEFASVDFWKYCEKNNHSYLPSSYFTIFVSFRPLLRAHCFQNKSKKSFKNWWLGRVLPDGTAWYFTWKFLGNFLHWIIIASQTQLPPMFLQKFSGTKATLKTKQFHTQGIWINISKLRLKNCFYLSNLFLLLKLKFKRNILLGFCFCTCWIEWARVVFF